MSAPLTVAVTGLNATDNPGPGVGVIRSLRHNRDDVSVVGLAYDALEPGVYADGLVSDVFMIPYPSQGVDPLRDRLAYIRERTGFDVIIPTLDAELPGFVELAPELAAQGVGTLLPTRSSSTCAPRRSSTRWETRGCRCPRRGCSPTSRSSTPSTR
nr:hypothetical protein [Deltaproteobacteria bacterium]